MVCTLCSCVMKTKQIWLFSAHMLPLLARLCLVPLETIVIINKFAMIFTGLEVLYFLGSNLLVPYNLAKSAYRELVQVRQNGTILFSWAMSIFAGKKFRAVSPADGRCPVVLNRDVHKDFLLLRTVVICPYYSIFLTRHNFKC